MAITLVYVGLQFLIDMRNLVLAFLLSFYTATRSVSSRVTKGAGAC